MKAFNWVGGPAIGFCSALTQNPSGAGAAWLGAGHQEQPPAQPGHRRPTHNFVRVISRGPEVAQGLRCRGGAAEESDLAESAATQQEGTL